MGVEMKKPKRRKGELILDYERDAVQTPLGCMEWKWGLDSAGYGFVRYGTWSYRAHRLAWRLFIGSIPSWMFIIHKCFNSKCFNIEHLRLGTTQENRQDADVAKLTEEDVLTIRDLYATGNYYYKELAEMFDCSFSNIAKIVQKDTWNNVK